MTFFKRSILLFLPLFVLFAITLLQTFSLSYYTEQFEKNHIVEVTGVGSDQLKMVAEDMIQYLAGLRDNLIFDVTDLQGNVTQGFEERELAHMDDVRKIFDVLRYFVMIYPILFIIVLYDAYKKKDLKAFSLSAARFLVFPSLILILLLFIAMSVNFDKAFILFHKMLFSNDLWLLDPETDLLIQMLPEVFFITIAQRILIGFGTVVSLGVIYLGFDYAKERL